MAKPKGMVHALVLWGRTAEDEKNGDTRTTCDVLKLSTIPRKFRKEGAAPTLRCMDKKKRKTSMKKGTVVKISDNVEELLRMSEGITGIAADSSGKLFGSDVRYKRKDLQQTKKTGTSNDETDKSEDEENDDTVDDTLEETIDDSESRRQRFMDAMKQLASQVTEENIQFLETLVNVMKASKLGITNPDGDLQIPYKIPEMYTTPGRGKVPLWEGMNFYFYDVVKAAIEAKSHVTDKSTGERIRHWPLLVRLALVEIYGKKLADHSAKGSKSGSRPAIDHRLFRAIHYWASNWVGNEVDIDAYVDHINKTCYNKRKGTPREILKRAKKAAASKNSSPIDDPLAPSPSSSQTDKHDIKPIELLDQTQPVSNDVNSSSANQYPNSNMWDVSDCNFTTLL